MLAAVMTMAMIIGAPKVIVKYDHQRAGREDLRVDLIERPAGASVEDFVAELIEAEGLKSWSAQDPTSSGPGSSVTWRARHAADGTEIVVYFVPSEALDRPGKVCRIRRSRGGASVRHWQALRWCHAAFGITLPAERPPPL